MHPVVFELHLFGSSIPFNSYGLMIGLSLILWGHFVRQEAQRLGYQRMADGTTVTMLILVAALFLGGKGLYLLTIADTDAIDSANLQTGFVFWGSIMAASPAMYFRLRYLGVPVLAGLDVFAAACPMSHALGRIGCFLAGCCYGHRCENFLGVTFNDGVGLRGIPLHPVQLYEFFGLTALFIYLWYYLRPRKTFDGQLLVSYFIGYSVLRCITELFRGDPGRRFIFGGEGLAPGDAPEGISTSVLLSFVMVVVGLIIYRIAKRRLTP